MGFWPCVARTRVHMCIYCVYTCTYVYIYIHKCTRVYSDTPARPIVDSTADLWVDRSKRGGNDSSFSLPSPFGSRSFYEQSGVFFFFPLRPISRVITNGDTRISLFERRTACLRKFRDEALAICFYLSRENGVPGKEYCLLSNTKLFRNVICETDPEAISGKQYYRKKSEKLYFERVEIHVECIPQVDSHRVCKNHSVSIKVLDTHFFVYYICEATKSCSIHTRYIYIFLRLRNDTSFVFLTTAYVDHLVAKKFAQLLIEFRYRF